MHKHIISDTSCLILFAKINELDLLYKTYGEVIITPEVAKEYRRSLPDWIKIIPVKNKEKQRKFEKLVDYGEASAIALALELHDSILIIDDKRGRVVAQKLEIKITGTLGTLLKAKQKKHINRIKPLIEKLKKINYRIAEDIKEGVLKKAGE